MIFLQQTIKELFQNTSKLQERIKKVYARNTKADDFKIGDVFLRWDAQNEDKGKHSKFENLWKGPYTILDSRGKNGYLLAEINGKYCKGGPINGRLLKHYLF